MKLKLDLVQDSEHQVLVRDISDISAGVSRVIFDFVTPLTKRIELNGVTEVKAYNFVNPLVNAFLSFNDTDFGQTGFNSDIYEIDYSIHYPYLSEIFVDLGNNMIYGKQMLTFLGDANWLYFNDQYYSVVRQYSGQDYLFLDRPVDKLSQTCELVYRDKVYLPLVEKLRSTIGYRFRNLTGKDASTKALDDLVLATFLVIGTVDNINHGDVKAARGQTDDAKELLKWDLEKQLKNFVPD